VLQEVKRSQFERQRLGGSWYKVSLGKKLVRPYLNQYPGVVVCTCHPTFTGTIKKRIMVQVGPGINMRPY
jgi:hypothetical protein